MKVIKLLCFKITMLTALIMCFTFSSVWAESLVTLHVQNTEIREVLTALAAIGKVNIVADESVTGKVSIQLNNVPFNDALDVITKSSGLRYQYVNNVIVVGASDKMGKNFGKTHFFKLKYGSAEELIKSLVVIVPEDRLKVDTSANTILAYCSDAEAEQIASILTELDIPYQQVSLEAQVLAINKSASKELGLEWSWEKTPTYPEYEKKYETTDNGLKVNETYTRDTRMGTIKFGKSPAGIPYEFYYQAKINALLANGNAQILAKPKITTINGKQAVIFIGDHIPVVTEKKDSSGQTTQTTEFVDAGIKLAFTPRINDDGLITAEVHTEVSTPSLVTEVKNYKITTRQADTHVRMHDGDTMVIGGLIGKEESETISKVPFLSDLPILGALFKNVSKVSSENEIVIFLTPHIVK